MLLICKRANHRFRSDLNLFKGRWNIADILNNSDAENRRNTVQQICSYTFQSTNHQHLQSIYCSKRNCGIVAEM